MKNPIANIVEMFSKKNKLRKRKISLQEQDLQKYSLAASERYDLTKKKAKCDLSLSAHIPAP